jgi:glutaminyl-tRNA synthetase
VTKDPDTGEVTELRCTYDPATRGGDAPDGRKVKATLHWVSATENIRTEVRLFDHLFSREDPNAVKSGQDFTDFINPDSKEVLSDCPMEPGLKSARPGDRFQFERLGYFCVDAVDAAEGRPVFNRTVTLRDTWKKIQKAIEKQKKVSA